MDGWMDGWMDGQINRQIDRQMDSVFTKSFTQSLPRKDEMLNVDLMCPNVIKKTKAKLKAI